MSPCLHAFLSGVLDYAGLFPPARLSLEHAFGNYVRYRSEPEGWILGRFICPAARLEELAKIAEEPLLEDGPIICSALGAGGATSQQLLANLRSECDDLRRFQNLHGGVVVDTIEVRLPALEGGALSTAGLQRLLQQAIELIDTRASALGQFYEATLTTNWQETVSSVVDGLTQVGDERPPVHGFKLRCGGLEAAAFPSVEQVAYALAECRDKRVPFKATAGLHHPIRRFDASVQCMMHGFLNVFGAGFLAGARNLSRQELGGILADENPQNFAIEQDHFRWKSVRASTDEVSAARKHALISFGSCSFDEPRDDLRSMGWL